MTTKPAPPARKTKKTPARKLKAPLPKLPPEAMTLEGLTLEVSAPYHIDPVDPGQPGFFVVGPALDPEGKAETRVVFQAFHRIDAHRALMLLTTAYAAGMAATERDRGQLRDVRCRVMQRRIESVSERLRRLQEWMEKKPQDASYSTLLGQAIDDLTETRKVGAA